ncbi:MAG: hypothetical protein ACRD0P_39040 [Stackebrandtia sp.]
MSDHDPAAPYVRRITIEENVRDAATQKYLVGHDLVHVGQRMLFDGVEYPGLVALDEGWAVSAASDKDPTIVSFCVDAEQVVHGRIDEATTHKCTGFTVAGVRFLVPLGHPWETIHHVDAPDVVRVYTYVAEVEIGGMRDRPGDRVTDGADTGVLADCPHCSGRGMLLVRDVPRHVQRGKRR